MSDFPPAPGAAAEGLRLRLGELRRVLEQRAEQPLPAGRLPFTVAGRRCGSVAPDIAAFVISSAPGFVLDPAAGLELDAAAGMSPQDRSGLLALAALALRDAGLIPGWRNENLDVWPEGEPGPGGTPLAVIERSACRPFGLSTLAVHLNAWADARHLWIAQRAAHKAIDPGMWDNLVGGMVPAGESLVDAMARESMEEAGLDTLTLNLRPGPALRFSRPVAEGFQVEVIHVFDTELPAGTRPRNLDGEVGAFACVTVNEVLERIEAGRFTLEAARVAVAGIEARLARRTRPADGPGR